MAKKKPIKKTTTKKRNEKTSNKPRKKPVSKPDLGKLKPARSRRKTLSGGTKPKAKTKVKSLAVVKTRKTSTDRKRKNAKSITVRNVKKRVKATVSKKITTQKIRGKNTITFQSGGKPENVAKKFNVSNTKKEINYYLQKNKQPGERFAKEPKAVAIIIKVKSQEGVIKVFSQISPPDMVVNDANVKKFVTDELANASNNFEDFYGEEIDKILNYSIKFIY